MILYQNIDANPMIKREEEKHINAWRMHGSKERFKVEY